MNRLSAVKEIKVSLDFGQSAIPVGRLALRDHRIYFAYEASFIEQGMEISPCILPLKAELTSFDNTLFEGLPGVFNDSLPDGWGRLLFDRLAQTQGVLPSELSPLDRLAYVGNHGMGALVYEPEIILKSENGTIRLDNIAQQALEVLKGSSEDVLQELLALNGSSAGARPKALIGVSKDRKQIIHGSQTLKEGYEPWLVKFPNSHDGLDSGAIEYVYALMAKRAGIEMADVHLFPTCEGPGYFATKRFDRDGNKRLHMHTACGLLHSDFRLPSLDYEDLIGLTSIMTHDIREMEKMFRLAVFNVLAHNRDDHAKNFSFLMDEKGLWKLSPAYDLTFSSGPGGEQSTMVMGEGKSPGVEHLTKLGKEAKLSNSRITEIIGQTQASVANWPTLAKHYGVTKAKTNIIAKRLGVAK
ncbi:MAG: type II toxin-antitoxin system HipA family toxin [Sphaerochaeta sp.]|nr:type II toxin-antitoxin system HipA family toxin [Sphaerochaeta sp.]